LLLQSFYATAHHSAPKHHGYLGTGQPALIRLVTFWDTTIMLTASSRWE
jgi:hypothetical protein